MCYLLDIIDQLTELHYMVDVTMIDETPGNSANKALVYRPVGYLINPSVRGVLEKLDSEMKSVDCIVPNWKSAIWEHKTLELNVKRKAFFVSAKILFFMQ